ncbi:MAG TPA: M23 family metallopeptidase [Gemmatimonadaceae bacterium]|nr:M23 family metallopeptidase [Gemmatimonadaceae bacterium]
MTVLCALLACEMEQPREPVSVRDAAIQDSMLRILDDTLTALASEPREVPVDKAQVVTATADTTAVTASAAELEELAARLVIPVAGIERDELRDTYAESRGSRPHDAIDIPAPRGTAVVSATAGRLLKLHNSVPGGLMVYAADASDRFLLMYGHLDGYAPGLSEGMLLRQGQLLGYVGTTGNAPHETPHLHLAIARGRPSVSWWRGTPVNPYPLLTRRER